ncbi:hypothetical protein [Gelidibacter sp.]|uniref:hypothetical protein n=1 Tax=Gelidibacter sp. TaxID=2018083 RepID=UPI002C528C65|nr:hypothetical protein [Gelidibacter sp.]HUH27561.1 hypothetical protein [Gelidibacter sp.]
MKYIIIIALLILNFNCSSTKNTVYFEAAPADLIHDENRFDLDNEVYPVNREILYQCIIEKNEMKLDVEVKFIRMSIQGTTKPFSNFDPNYSQTVIKFDYLDQNKKTIISERTGLVENNVNIWLHPPRNSDLGVLQLSAFPYIKLNAIKNWEWNLEASYGNFQKVHLAHYYKKRTPVSYNSKLGPLECVVVDATTKSTMGKTNAEFLYHDELGFVKMTFHTIDGNKITLEMINGEL